MTKAGDGASGCRSASRRWSERGIALLATTAIIALGAAAPGGAAAPKSAAARAHFAKVGTRYATYQRLCAAARPGHSACMAVRRVNASKRTPGAHPYAVHAGYPVGPSGFGLTPADFATAYHFDPSGGAGQTVAVVDAYDDPNILSDLDTFDAQYGIAAETPTSFIKVGQTGSTTSLPVPDTTGWSGEEALDVETVRGVCRACTIVLVEANSSLNSDLQKGVQSAVQIMHATEVSNSYGGPEPKHATPKRLKKLEAPYDHKGVVITASTGDDGWFSWDVANAGHHSAEAPNAPASLPSVVSVGGTRLDLKANGTRRAESVWNENGAADKFGLQHGPSGATGGGCSRLFKAKGWQSNIAGYAKTGCGKHRLAADISADADPETGYDVYTSYPCGPDCFTGWGPIGGTSLSSPLIAAMWAVAGGSGGVPYPALSVYGHANSAHPPRYDVTKGGNSWCDQDPKCSAHTHRELGHGIENPNDIAFNHRPLGTLDCGFARRTVKPTLVRNNHQCNAAKGYDGPTGVGTPNGLSIFKPMTPRASISHGKAKAKAKTTFQAGGHDPFPGGRFVKFHWTFGDGAKSGGAAPTHTFKQPGKYLVTLTATDNYGRAAVTTASVKVAS